MKKYIIRSVLFDIMLTPLVLFSAIILLIVRKIGFDYMKKSKQILLKIGVMPIRDHYYEPLFNGKHLTKLLSADRHLPGINMNTDEQLFILNLFQYKNELTAIPDDYVDDLVFHFNNGSFLPGDAEYWYSIIRLRKPALILEIGSGNSTKIAQLAIKKNKQENSTYHCEHICIEPYEIPWLEQLDVIVIRSKVEDVDKCLFNKLKENDILFIDSSHIIRPQGDVLYEFLEILPVLNKGVIVHIHDIFTPKDYPKKWIVDQVRLWNEQYLLEAFLTSNKDWRIIGSLNYLHHNFYENLKNNCPRLKLENEPGSFYIVKHN